MTTAHRKLGPLTLDLPAAFIGVQILLKGVEKLDSFGHHPLLVASLLLLGGIVLVASLLPLWLEKRFHRGHALFHLAEGVAMNLSAILLFEKGKLRIPVILAFIGLVYVAIAFLESRPLAQRERLAGPMLKGTGWAFVAGAFMLAGFTASRDHDVWAYGAAGLFLAVGSALLLAAPRLLRARAS